MAEIKRPKFNLEQEDLRPQQTYLPNSGPQIDKKTLRYRNITNAPFTKGASLGAVAGLAAGQEPGQILADAVVMGAANAGLNAASKRFKPVANATSWVGGKAANLASAYPKTAAIASRATSLPVAAGLAGAELGYNSYLAKQDIDEGKDNTLTGRMRQIMSPVYALDNFIRSDDKKGFSGYIEALKEEVNQGSEEVARAKEAKSLEAQIAAEEAKRPKQGVAAAPQGQTWEEQRAGLAQAMANSVKENPDNPYAWDVTPGFGTVVGSDGKPKYVVPNKPYDPDKAYEQEMRDRAYQYYMDSMSMAGSPFATPERKAAELARANSLAQTFGLGVDLNAVAAGGGGGLRAGASNATLNKMIDLQLKGEENKKELIKEQQKAIMEQFPDDKDKGLRAQNNALAATDFSNVNPHSAEDMNRVRLENQINAELAAEMERVGATGGNINGITKRTPGWGFGEAWNAIPFLPEWLTIDPNYYVQSHGKEYALNEKNLSKGARAKADKMANQALDNQALNAQYNAYVREGGKLSFPEWKQQLLQGK